MKKLLLVLLALVMLFAVSACQSETQEEQEATVKEETATQEETTTEQTEEAVEVNYPAGKELTIVFGKKTGSMGDLIIRSVARYLQDEIGKPVVVINQKGAGGRVAAIDFLQNQQADSDTIILFGNALFTIMPLYETVEFDIDDFEPLIGLDSQDRIMFVNPEKEGIDSLEKLIEYGQENRILYTSSGVGTSKDLVFKTLFEMSGVEADLITDDGSPLASVLGKHVDVCLAAPADGRDYYRQGLVPVAVISDTPYTGYEGIEVPTLASQGYEIYDTGYRFIAMAKGTDQAIIDYMYEAINNVLNNPEFVAEMEKMEVYPSGHNPEEVKEKIMEMQERYKAYIAIVAGE